MVSKRIAIIGAGPVGLEAALHAANRGHDVQVYERGRVGEHVRQWGFVRLFSAMGLNRSELGRQTLGLSQRSKEEDDAYWTGTEYVERYLLPLSTSPTLTGRIHEHTQVRQIGREGLAKFYGLDGSPRRSPFRLLLDRPDGERIVHADTVLDCSGTYSNPIAFGDGNIPCLGERQYRAEIAYTLEDFAGSQRDRYTGRHVLLIGSGHSAATAVDALLSLKEARITWAARTNRQPPYALIPNDPLPARDRLVRMANKAAAGHPRVDYRCGAAVESIAKDGDLRYHVVLRQMGQRQTVTVDRVVALVGYAPDRSLYEQLQVHECYATGGPMKLAASLLAGDGLDCLSQSSAGPATLINPEPDFYILGAKSYGRRSNFLIRLGLEQIHDAFQVIDRDDESQHHVAGAETR